jgi:serine/threonine-protein kinase
VRDLTLGREVALKLLHPASRATPDAPSAVFVAGGLAAQLAHPAIVPIFDWDSRGDVAWYTMELAEGGSVADLVRDPARARSTEIAPQIDFILSGLLGRARDRHRPSRLEAGERSHRLATGVGDSDFGIANATGETSRSASDARLLAPPSNSSAKNRTPRPTVSRSPPSSRTR